MAIWKKVLTSADISQAVTDGVTDLVPSSDAVADAIAAAQAAASSGDITEVAPYPNGGVVVWQDTDGNGTFAIGPATSGDAQLQVKAGLGITVDSNGVNIASTAAGAGLGIASGILSVNTGVGLATDGDLIKANVDGSTIETNPSVGVDLGKLRVKDGGVSFAKLSGSAVMDSNEVWTQTDNQLATPAAISAALPNVVVLGNQNYVSESGVASQTLTFSQINIGTDTDLAVATASGAQDSLQVTLTDSVLSATAPNLGVNDDVQFVDLSLTGTLDVDGNVVLGNSTTNTVTIAGNLIVQGETTTLDVANLKVEDKIIALATAATTPLLGTNAGIQITTGTDELEFPELKWVGNSALAGWQVQNYVNGRSDDNDLVSIAVMEVKSNATPTQASLSAGVGAFWFDETSDALYIRTA